MILRNATLALFLALSGCHAGSFGAATGGGSGGKSNDGDEDDIDDADDTDDDDSEQGNMAAEVSGAFLTCDPDADAGQYGCAVNGASGEKLDATATKMEIIAITVRHWLGTLTLTPKLRAADPASKWHVFLSAPYGAKPTDLKFEAQLAFGGTQQTAAGKDEMVGSIIPDETLPPGQTGDEGGGGEATLPDIKNCADAQADGMTKSGLAFVVPFAGTEAAADGGAKDRDAEPSVVYCDQETDGGGWTLVFNSVPYKLKSFAFWAIPPEERFLAKGDPDLLFPYYDGLNYLIVMNKGEVRDVVVDKDGTEETLYVGSVDMIDETTLAFSNAAVAGAYGSREDTFLASVGGEWLTSQTSASSGLDPICESADMSVSQHYSPRGCWSYNLGSDHAADDDGKPGPHMRSTDLISLGLATDGSLYSIVGRISRFVRPATTPP